MRSLSYGSEIDLDLYPKQLFFSFDPCVRNFWCTNFFGLAQDSYGPIEGQGGGYFKNKQWKKDV